MSYDEKTARKRELLLYLGKMLRNSVTQCTFCACYNLSLEVLHSGLRMILMLLRGKSEAIYGSHISGP